MFVPESNVETIRPQAGMADLLGDPRVAEKQVGQLLRQLPEQSEDKIVELGQRAAAMERLGFLVRGLCVLELLRRQPALKGGRGKKDAEGQGRGAHLKRLAAQIGIDERTLRDDARIVERFFDVSAAGSESGEYTLDVAIQRFSRLGRDHYRAALSAPDPAAIVEQAREKAEQGRYSVSAMRADLKALRPPSSGEETGEKPQRSNHAVGNSVSEAAATGGALLLCDRYDGADEVGRDGEAGNAKTASSLSAPTLAVVSAGEIVAETPPAPAMVLETAGGAGETLAEAFSDEVLPVEAGSVAAPPTADQTLRALLGEEAWGLLEDLRLAHERGGENAETSGSMTAVGLVRRLILQEAERQTRASQDEPRERASRRKAAA